MTCKQVCWLHLYQRLASCCWLRLPPTAVAVAAIAAVAGAAMAAVAGAAMAAVAGVTLEDIERLAGEAGTMPHEAHNAALKSFREQLYTMGSGASVALHCTPRRCS